MFPKVYTVTCKIKFGHFARNVPHWSLVLPSAANIDNVSIPRI